MGRVADWADAVAPEVRDGAVADAHIDEIAGHLIPVEEWQSVARASFLELARWNESHRCECFAKLYFNLNYGHRLAEPNGSLAELVEDVSNSPPELGLLPYAPHPFPSIHEEYRYGLTQDWFALSRSVVSCTYRLMRWENEIECGLAEYDRAIIFEQHPKTDPRREVSGPVTAL